MDGMNLLNSFDLDDHSILNKQIYAEVICQPFPSIHNGYRDLLFNTQAHTFQFGE